VELIEGVVIGLSIGLVVGFVLGVYETMKWASE
jgi:hypothetical protein